jgi:hypothetical protein
LTIFGVTLAIAPLILQEDYQDHSHEWRIPCLLQNPTKSLALMLVDYFVGPSRQIQRSDMEAARSSKPLVFYRNTTWRHNPEDFNLNHHCYDNLKS